MKRTVASVLEAKGSDIYSIGPDDSVYAALELMEGKRVGALVVTDGDELVGVISERDFAREMLTHDGGGPRDMLVSDIMTRNVFTVSPESNVGDCMAMMTDKRIRHLPVLDGGQLVGIISIGDVVSAVITFQEGLIADLERYITG